VGWDHRCDRVVGAVVSGDCYALNIKQKELEIKMANNEMRKTPLAEAVERYRKACRGYDLLIHSAANLTADQAKKRKAELIKALALKREVFGQMRALNGGRIPDMNPKPIAKEIKK